VERPDGRHLTVLAHANPICAETGELLGAVNVLVDITERKRGEDALQKADRNKNEFLATLAHELRNPLAPIANALEVMKRAGDASPVAAESREIAERQLRHMVRLVDDLLDVGRITAGKITLDLQPVALGGLVHDAVEMVAPLVDQRGHVLTLALPDAPAVVSGDRARLLQVVSNLLNNAARYTPPGGRIHVELRILDSGGAEISVRDNGPGIPSHQLKDIFNIFVQGEHNSESGGLGLGLSLVQQLVTLHRGAVSVFSTGQPGEGSEFVVRFPLMRAPPSDADRAVLPPG